MFQSGDFHYKGMADSPLAKEAALLSSTPGIAERVELVRKSGVPMSNADDKRVADSIAASLVALDKAVNGSLFDTEPQTFDVVARRLAQAPKP